MSSFYILDSTTNSKKAEKTYVDEEIEKLKLLSKEEDKKLLDLAGTRQMQDDIDLGDNTCIGVGLINASNSAVPRSYIDTNFVTRTSETIMSANLNMSNYSIKNLPNPTLSQHPTTKDYVDTALNTKLSSIHVPVCYNYVCTFPELTQNSWKYPRGSFYDKPDLWMYIPSGLTDQSYFELQYHIFDTDNSFPSGSMSMEYRLQVFQGSTLKTWSFFDGNIKAYRISGENMCVIGQKYYFKDFPSANYKQFTLARLSVKRKFSGSFGNKSRVGLSIVS